MAETFGYHGMTDAGGFRFTVPWLDGANFRSSTAFGGSADPHAANVIDCRMVTDKGIGCPVLTTTQRDAVSSWPAGTLIYNSTLAKLQIRTASAWETVTSS